MNISEVDNVLKLLDAMASKNDERGRACFEAARVIRNLKLEIEREKNDSSYEIKEMMDRFS